MYLYLLADSDGWVNTELYTKRSEARETALRLMDRAAWEGTYTMRVCRIDTRKKSVEDVEFVIHGAYRAEAHKVEDK